MKKLAIFLVIASPIYPLKLGIENIPFSLIQKLKRSKIALIVNQTSIDQNKNRTVDVLLNKSIPIKYLLAPEHGIAGTVAAGKTVDNSVDLKTKIPILSLYKKGTGKHLDENVLQQIDTIVFDVQDAGMRHYTYISTLLYALQKAAEHNKQFIVLDRPNLLGGRMCGPLVQKELQSFISIAPIPLRYGVTIGELAVFFNTNILQKKAKLFVVKMKEYNRNKPFRLLAPLSPNITNLQSCYGYSFLGLLGEVRPFDVGIGTQLAFRCILLADELKITGVFWKECANLLHKYGVGTKPYHYFSDRKRKWYTGLQLYIQDIGSLKSFELFLSILSLSRKYKLPIRFSDFFNRAVGSIRVREYFDKKISLKPFIELMQQQSHMFMQKMDPYVLYRPFPTIL